MTTTVSAMGAVLMTASEGASGIARSVAVDTTPEAYRECPGDRHSYSRKDSISVYAAAAASPIEKVKNIPEFHDCQKLLLDSGRAYGPLVAIFATYDLESLERRLIVLDTFATGKVALAGAVLHNFGELYSPLQLEPGWSCLYLWRVGNPRPKWRATLTHVTGPELCEQPYLPASDEPGRLEVRRDPAAHFTQVSDYPAVARWDWDDRNKQQYMGIQCGAAWCEVGNPGVRPSLPYLRRATTGSNAERVKRIKGWYDEQSLAEPNGAGGTLVPGAARATVIPAPNPALADSMVYHRKWAKVAYVAVTGSSPYYEKKLNLYSTFPGAPLSRLNVLSFCKGTRRQCRVPPPNAGIPFSAKCEDDAEPTPTERWWVRIDAPAARLRQPMYRCVSRVGHETEGVAIPSTARWHWLRVDETVWKECVTGCCQVRVPGSG